MGRVVHTRGEMQAEAYKILSNVWRRFEKEKTMSKEQIEEVFKDLCEAPTGGVNEDFTIGTLKESHTNLFIRTLAGHLVSLNYRKQREGRWYVGRVLNKSASRIGRNVFFRVFCCSACEKSNGMHRTKYCPNYGAKMKGD
jgi:hypothetical protein